MSKTFLSILVPVFNVGKYIDRCLTSVFNQITNDCEVILVDDGSTDESGKICDLYQAKFPAQCKVFHKENQGAYPTRNFALERAQGEYIWLIDPDDYIEPNAVESIRAIIGANDNLDIITAAYRRFNDSWVGEIENCEKEPHIVSGKEFLIEGRFHNAYLWHHIYRRRFIEFHSIQFNNKINTQGDWLFNAYAYVAAKRIYLSDELIYNYYQGNPTSTLARRDKPHLLRGVNNSLTAILEMENLCKYYRDSIIFEPLKKRLSLTISGFLYSLYRFNIPIDIVKYAIKVCENNGLYPVAKTNNKKANLFIAFANCKWFFISSCSLKNSFLSIKH